jgi:Leucine-rich repeat (LRR) protein
MKELIVSSVKKVGEVLVSSFIQSLCDRLVVPEFLDFVGGAGLQENLEKLRKTLATIQAMLDDVEEKQYTERVVKEWLDDLRDLAYDVDDIVDELTTDASTAAENQARPSKVRKLTPSAWFTPSTSSHFKINSRLALKIKEVTDRFNDIVTREGQLNLNKTAPDGKSYRIRGTLEPTSVMTDAHVYGREKEIEAILQLLLGEKCSDAGVSVIPILGMGGIGKTTLAQLVYNDKKVQSSFELKAWACVSEDFDVDRVTRTILQSLTSDNCDGKDRNWLQVKLKEKLQGKKFLVVLDDLWNEKYHDWTILRAPFLGGALGSTIVITTRNQRVSSTTGTIPAYRLQVLSDDACLSVFTQNALGESNFGAHPNLQDIGEKIVERCKGLPLAAKTLGGLLRTTEDRDEWEDVLKSKIWDISEERSGIVPALMISYHHLPSHLKRCFAYCSIFPHDYEFEEEQLVLLWIAEGLIQPSIGDKQMEDLGSEYFHNLLSRSFFQQSSTKKSRFAKRMSSLDKEIIGKSQLLMPEKSRFVMHDLINDLAQWVAGDICFRMEDRIGGFNGRTLPKKSRHSSYLGGECDIAKKFEAFFELACLRTFLPLMLPSLGHCYLTHNVPLQLLPKLLCLRVLSLSGYFIVELSDSIGDLKHLRYLDLSYTRIRGLPESTTTLYNLQTLILEGCSCLNNLPSNLGNLVNLRHLNIVNTYKLEGMPLQIDKLTHLQTLSNLIVGKGNCFALKELGSLLHLRGMLIISQLENAIEPIDARDAKLIEKPNLTVLCLEWSNKLDESLDRTSEFEVLNMLQPHKTLKELTIKCYGGMEFPTWVSGHSFSHMVVLRIENCKKCTSLPPVGQLQSLKHLFIEGMASVKNISHEFYGFSCSQPFESLETLKFTNMEEWENWSPNQEFRHLRKLSIRHCPKLLGKLPNHFPLLENVLVQDCPRLVVSISSFPELCRLQIGESEGVMHENKVVFNTLNSKCFSTISEFTYPIEGFILEGLTEVKNLNIDICEELTPLWSNDVGLLQSLPCLRVLTIHNYQKRVSLVEKVKEQPKEGMSSTNNGMGSLAKEIMSNNMCLEKIVIYGCDSLTHIARGQLPPTLKRLCIQNCKHMRILLDEDDANRCSTSTSSLLEYLKIEGCPSLKFVELPATLQQLDIRYCGQLESIAKSEELLATLKQLDIWGCGQLESIAKSFHHNSSLEKIDIRRCENLKSLPTGIHTLSHLGMIHIRGCPTLASFPDGGLLPSNLRKLTIVGDMPRLPNCIHNLTSLQNLEIWRKSPNVVSVVSSFSEEGFPANLTSLTIGNCNFTQALLEWGLHRLTSLQYLCISGGCPNVESFPEKMLPASLTNLSIRSFPNLKYLSSLQSLTSLQELQIGWCKNLTSFPEDGLLPSLLRLHVSKCPLLKEHCKKDHGREWFKMAHIPYVEIDWKFIYDPEDENQ